MRKRAILKPEVFYAVTFLFIMFILQPLDLFGQEVNPQKPNKVEIKAGFISVDVEDTDLIEVLKKIEKGTGVKITIAKELIGKKITVSFKDLDIEKALRTILGNNYVFVFLKDQKEYVLKEVMAVGIGIGSKPSKGKMITKEIAYGKGKEDVGAVNAGEGAMGGPPSFTVDDKGNIYILDPLNNRIQIFSRRGEYLYSIPLKTGASDIAIGKYGFIYIYVVGERKLYQYERNGNIINAIDIHRNRNRKGAGSNMHIRNNKVYVDASDQSNVLKEFLIAEIVNGALVVPTDEELKKPIEKGYGLSGRRYKVTKFIRGEKAEMEIIERDGTMFKSISVPVKDIISIGFLGEDKKGNFYVKTERSERHEDKTLVDGYRYKIFVDVHKFNPEGEYLNTINMPESRVSFVPNKDYFISKDGTIYWFLPEKDKLRLEIFN